MNLFEKLSDWPKVFISVNDLSLIIGGSADACYSVIKRAVKNNFLIRLKRGLFLIKHKMKQLPFDKFELAHHIYSPSYISLEAALSYHGWIPEIVYSITSATVQRNKEFKTPEGFFTFQHVPIENFYLGVERKESENICFFIASPWRSLADYIYVKRRYWDNLSELEKDMRIDIETIQISDISMLKELSKNYPSKRVRTQLQKFYSELA